MHPTGIVDKEVAGNRSTVELNAVARDDTDIVAFISDLTHRLVRAVVHVVEPLQIVLVEIQGRTELLRYGKLLKLVLLHGATVLCWSEQSKRAGRGI